MYRKKIINLKRKEMKKEMFKQVSDITNTVNNTIKEQLNSVNSIVNDKLKHFQDEQLTQIKNILGKLDDYVEKSKEQILDAYKNIFPR